MSFPPTRPFPRPRVSSTSRTVTGLPGRFRCDSRYYACLHDHALALARYFNPAGKRRTKGGEQEQDRSRFRRSSRTGLRDYGGNLEICVYIHIFVMYPYLYVYLRPCPCPILAHASLLSHLRHPSRHPRRDTLRHADAPAYIPRM